MNRLALTSAIALLGTFGLATGPVVHAQSAPPIVPNQSRTILGPQGNIVVRGPSYEANFQNMADLKLETAGAWQGDSVYVDGTYVGVAGDISDLGVIPGPHELMLCAPDGTVAYRHVVSTAIGEPTEVRPFQAVDNGTPDVPPQAPIMPRSSKLAPVYNAPETNAYIPEAAGQGRLKISAPYEMRDDAVFVDGNYVGLARKVKDLSLTTGTHNVALCAPDGRTDYQTDVGIALNKTTNLSSFLNG